MDIKNKAFFCSWSGGKDSCLSLYYAIKQGGIPKRLLTMLVEDGQRSRSHGLSLELLKKQSESLNIPLITYSTSWTDYEAKFLIGLEEIKKDGIEIGVFGDMDIEDHKEWVEKVCRKADIVEYLPLWKKPRRNVVNEFIECGFKAIIVAFKEDILFSEDLLGRELDEELVKEFETRGIDPAGENGEFHTVVIDGPIFNSQLKYKLEDKINVNGYWFQNISITQE